MQYCTMSNKESQIFSRLAEKSQHSNLSCKHAACIVHHGKIIDTTICCNHDRTKIGNSIVASCHAEMSSIKNYRRLKKYVLRGQ